MKKILLFLAFIILSTISAKASDMRFVQVDSMLLSASEEKSIEKMQKVINDINNQKNIEFVVFTGDNIANPKQENLEYFVKIAKDLKKPYYIALGSKDINKNKHFSKKDYINILKTKSRFYKKIDSPNYVIEKKDIIFIIVDGSKEVIATPMGYYKKSTLDWLETQLSYYSGKNIVIFQHFPLIPPVNKETRATIKPEAYLEILNNYKNVKAIFSGNFNLNSEKDINGIIHFTTANAPQYRIVDIKDYESENPTFWSVIKE